jgi:putative dimethyl sulfoxide reductase chaperone
MPGLQISTAKTRSAEVLSYVAGQRSEIYRWLALGFYHPDEHLVNALNNGQFRAGLSQATEWLGQDQALFVPPLAKLDFFRGLALAPLAAEYSGLFERGVHRILLRESAYIWRDARSLGQTGSLAARALTNLYAAHGLQAGAGSEEHAAVELEFCAYLCTREAAAWRSYQFLAARELRRTQRQFLDDHLGHWLPELAWRITRQAPTSFYACLAEICTTWLSIDQGPGYQPV